MGQFHYEVVRQELGWAYRLGSTYSRLYPDQETAMKAATAEALRMHERGDDTQVRVQGKDGKWRTEYAIGIPPVRKE